MAKKNCNELLVYQLNLSSSLERGTTKVQSSILLRKQRMQNPHLRKVR
jgi:hypothetical protein